MYTPRSLRKGKVNKSGAKGPEKKAQFKRCKLVSDLYIHQSASALESPRLFKKYEAYRIKTQSGNGFRRG